MPVFTAVGAYVAGTVLGLVGTAAVVVGAIVATGAAFITSRIINGNPNKGVNSATSQGGRIQVPPATNNKIPVLYGSAYMNGIITDARLVNENKTMYYCIVLSETCNDATATYTVDDIYWNDLRLTTVDSTTNAHKVKDGRKTVDGPGEDFIDTNFVVDGTSLVEVRVYSGSTASAKQIWPLQSSGNTVNAYTYWAGNDGSWDSTYQMKGLVFAIVKVNYNGDKGFTGLPNMTFKLSNSINNPADVWYDYMTGDRYGAGIDSTAIDATAKTAWKNFCNEQITYTNVNGTANQLTKRYTVNGVIDTSRPVKDNIDIILQNGGAWMSYNVATGLWSPVIKKAITAGEQGATATYFTATRTGTTLTVTNFPAGRIEVGQRLYNSSGTYLGSISAQLTPTGGETAGQLGRYTTTTSGTIASTTFYTLPFSQLAFSDDNIISGINISSTRLDDLYNQFEAEFYDKYNKDQKAYSRLSLPSGERNPNEPDNQLRMSLDLVNNSVQAELLGQMEMRQSRDDLVIEFTTNQYGIQAQAGDVISVTNSLYGWAPKLFRVMRVKEQETEEGGLVATIQALEYNPDVYTVEPITEFTTSANIGIGNLVSSVNLPAPDTPVITNPNPDASVPNFTYNVLIPSTGGPFDEVEIYYTEGWDPNSVTGSIVPGTGSNGVPVGKGLMTVTSVTYNSINPGDYFDLGGVTVESQLTQTAITTKTRTAGGSVGTYSFTVNSATGIVIGQKPTGTGIPSGAMIVGISGTTITLDQAFTVQATGSYQFTTAGGTGTYQVNTSITTSGTDDLYDQPIESDFKYLKKIVPPGNASAFTAGSTIAAVITELPANSQTYRRWFLKSRMGWKKNFGAFSGNSTVDLNSNVGWNPNPSGSGSPGSFGNITIGQVTPNTIGISSPSPNEMLNLQADVVYIHAVSSVVGSPQFAYDADQGILSVQTQNYSIDGDITPSGLQVENRTTLTDDIVRPLAVTTRTQSANTVGSGTGILFNATYDEPTFMAGMLDVVMTDATTNNKDFKYSLSLAKNNMPTEVVTISSNGDLTLNGTSQFITFSTQPQGTNTMYGIRGMSALDDPWFVGSGSVGIDQGYLEIATGDNSGSGGSLSGGQIYVRQYNGQGNGGAPWYGGNGTVQNELILLDNVGNTTIPNNLTVDSGTLFVDSTNNRVGINNTSPSYELHIDNGSDSITQFAMTNNERTFILTNNGGDDLLSFNYDNLNRLQFNTTDQWFSYGKLGVNTNTPAYTLDVVGGFKVTTSLSAERPVLQYDNSTAGINSSLFLRKNYGSSTYTTADGVSLAFQLDSDSQATNQLALVSAEWNSSAPTIYLSTNINNNTAGPFVNAASFSTSRAYVAGDLTVNGNDIKSSGDVTAISLSSADVTIAGDLTVTGNDIKKSGGTTVVTFSGTNSTTLAGDLTVTGNTIKSSSATALTLSGANVTTSGSMTVTTDLTVDSGTLKVDSTNNRVGINKSSPTTALDVVGSILATGDIQGDSLTANNRIDTDGLIKQYSTTYGAAQVETQVFYYTATGNTIATADQWSATSFRTGKYTLSMSKGTDYHCIEMMIIHNGTTAYMTQYNEMFTNASLATFSTDISGGYVRLRVTPATTGSLEMNIERRVFTAI